MTPYYKVGHNAAFEKIGLNKALLYGGALGSGSGMLLADKENRGAGALFGGLLGMGLSASAAKALAKKVDTVKALSGAILGSGLGLSAGEYLAEKNERH